MGIVGVVLNFGKGEELWSRERGIGRSACGGFPKIYFSWMGLRERDGVVEIAARVRHVESRGCGKSGHA